MTQTFHGWTWRFRAWVWRVIDGDTLELLVDQGFGGRQLVRVRLIDVYCREIHGVPRDSEEYRLGKLAQAYVEKWCADRGNQVIIETVRSGEAGQRKTFDRYLAYVYAPDAGSLLNSEIIDAGHGTAEKPPHKLLTKAAQPEPVDE